MARNGKVEEEQLDAEHELPAGEGGGTSGSAQIPAASDRVSEVEKLRAERDSLLDRLARMQAEFDNARKRASKEQQDFRDFALADAIKTLLPVVDNFERALQSKSDTGDFRAGVELIYKQLRDVLTKLGVQPIEAKGQQFD